jgi:hypothetical protein
MGHPPYWDDWTHFESFVLSVPLIGGTKRLFLHRSEHLFKIWSAAREVSGQLTFYPSPAPSLLAAVETARRLAHARNAENCAPTSADFLYSVCLNDSALSQLLQEAGLQLQELEETVEGAKKRDAASDN